MTDICIAVQFIHVNCWYIFVSTIFFPFIFMYFKICDYWQMEERLRKKRNKILHTKTGSANPMNVQFNKYVNIHSVMDSYKKVILLPFLLFRCYVCNLLYFSAENEQF